MAKRKKLQEQKPIPVDREGLKALGYIIDDMVYPHVAYKGPRFAPTDTKPVMTDLEFILFEALKSSEDHHDYCNWGDAWERECATQEGGTRDTVEAALQSARSTYGIKEEV